MPEFSALILAGGRASRFGGTDLYREKLGGKSMLSHSIDMCDANEHCREIIVSVSPAVRSWIEGDVLTFGSDRMQFTDAQPDRQSSALAAAKLATAELLVIMDANRPYSGDELLERVLREATVGTGCAPCLDCTDPPATRGEQVSADAGETDFFGARKSESYSRNLLRGNLNAVDAVLLQHPQAYRREDYIRHAEAAGELSRFADDSEVFMAGGGDIILVPGRSGNFRVVSHEDLRIMQKIMGGPSKKKQDGKYGGLGW
ncbi:2-C-methyl-D-erythritol 4-phosphate cytidylyltransferase [bacterium]|nr:2-C-methyl-D-erythritol 4-phosphate cytidylyltransferase [bacterium]